MAGPVIVRIEVSVAWWLRWYLSALMLVALTMRMQPDPEKVAAVVRRALRMRTHIA